MIIVLLLFALSFAALPGSTASAAEPEPVFCESQTLHDYLAPLERMPKLRELPPLRGRAFRFRGAEIRSSGPALAISGGRVGYELLLGDKQWNVTATLSRVDWRGRVVQRIGQRHRRRLPDLGPTPVAELNFTVPGKPTFYKATLLIRSSSGRKLGEFGNYYHVIRPSVKARLATDAGSYQPGSTLFARIENPGAAFALFGYGYKIEKAEGETWAVAPESPVAPSHDLHFVAPGTTGGRCLEFPIPTTMPRGRYRISQLAKFFWPLQPSGLNPRRMLRDEFEVAPLRPVLVRR